jgi:hypothetical protein
MELPIVFVRSRREFAPAPLSAVLDQVRARSIKILSPYRLFYFFCAAVYPCIALGAVFLSFRTHPLFGITTAIILASWAFNSFSTTCRRCAFYGTSKCGLPGLAIPYFFKKRSVASLPRWRIWANYYIDIGLMVYLNAIYLLHPVFSPIVLFATGVVWMVIYRKKRFHGLMHLLKA